MNHFISSAIPPDAFGQAAWWFIFQNKRLLVYSHPAEEGPGVVIPRVALPDFLNPESGRVHFLGTLDGVACYAADLPQGSALPEGFAGFSLRRLFGQLPDDLIRVAGRAIHILEWDRNHQFCGRCGTPTEMASDRAKVCPNCGLQAYPRISPAVIMAVVKQNQLLLAHAHRHPEGFYSVLAGFAEPGETLEEAVSREVREEVALDVKNIRYFGSQPWPFPDSLMIGFICEYAGGEIDLRDSELADAGWYLPGDFPGMTPPPEISIAGQLIQWFSMQANRE